MRAARALIGTRIEGFLSLLNLLGMSLGPFVKTRKRSLKAVPQWRQRVLNANGRLWKNAALYQATPFQSAQSVRERLLGDVTEPILDCIEALWTGAKVNQNHNGPLVRYLVEDWPNERDRRDDLILLFQRRYPPTPLVA